MKTLKILLAGWLRPRAEAARRPRRAPRARPRLEYLEERLAPALLTVTSAADAHQDGLQTLREAVAVANADAGAGQSDTISFDPSLGSATITLTGGQLELSGASGSATETIDGGGGITVSGNHASRVFQIDAGVQAALAGLTITQGRVIGAAATGGGVFSAGSTVLISDCTLSSNQAIGNDGSAGAGSGGGLYVAGGSVTIEQSTLSANQASGGAGPDGPGHLVYVGIPPFGHYEFRFDGPGGPGGPGYGGGIYVAGGTVAVNQSTLSADQATGGPGGPGAPYGADGAGFGGGIYLAGGTVAVNQSTLSAGQASGSNGSSGGGIYSGGTLTARNSIVAGNSSAGSGPDVSGAADASSGYNLIGNGSGLSGISDGVNHNQVGSAAGPIDPRLAALANNGGPTQTIALLPGSPARGAGSTADATQYDQRGPGFPRVVNGAIDVGAFETQPSTPLTYHVTSLLDAGAGSGLSGDLRYCVTQTNANTGFPNTIVFDVAGTIALGSALPSLSDDVAINGPGAATLTLSGNHAVRVLAVNAGVSAHLADVTIADGMVANAEGGGIYSGGTLTVSSSTFAGNSAGYGGGGISSFGTLTVTSSTFTGNSSGFFGGGISNSGGGTLTVTSSTFAGNSATVQYGGGGGIYSSGTLTVSSSTFAGNSATDGGGIDGGTLTVSSSTFAGNSASGSNAQGGGIYNGGTLTVCDSTFTGNSAYLGGGIYNVFYGTLTVNSSTFAGNSANDGGGIYNDGSLDPPRLTVSNSIVAGNSSAGTPDIFGAVEARSGYNLIGNGSGLTGISDGVNGNRVGTAASPIDPRLAPLGNYGGPTQTFALLPGSPALGAGDPSLAGSPDQRGATRDGGVNIGAFQASAASLVVSAPAAVTAGDAFDVSVAAYDAFNQPAVGYTGTVTLSSTDPQANLLGSHAFTLADGGSFTFAGVGLATAGTQTLSADDALLHGSADVTVAPAAAVALAFTAPDNVQVGVPFTLIVTALDAYGNRASGYAGTVVLSRSDGGDPVEYAFTADDAGQHAFTVTVTDPGVVSFFIRDRDNPALSGDQLDLVF